MAGGPLRAVVVGVCALAFAAVAGCATGPDVHRIGRLRAAAPVPTTPPATPSTPPSPPAVPAARQKPPPVAPAYPYGAYSMTGTSAVALTFDDGPTWTWTEQILRLLREQQVKATFCIVGKMARTYPDRVRQIVADGHTLCNHSFDHDVNLGTLSEAKIRANLQATNDAIHAAVPNVPISYFRQPGGAWTPRVIKVAAELGMTSIHWDVDPRDWSRPGAQAIVNQVLSHTRPGSIVLLHDGGGDRSGTVEACRLMLPTLKARFQLVPLPPRPTG